MRVPRTATTCASACARSASAVTIPGRLYRALRGLEEAGLVRSKWQASSGGPDRRTYELTRAGEERLRDAATELKAMHAILDTFLCRCDTSPTLDTAGRPA
jgi:DNA-binding PadR family transcriptional regulator